MLFAEIMKKKNNKSEKRKSKRKTRHLNCAKRFHTLNILIIYSKETIYLEYKLTPS